jgi:hypothetical protein
MIEEIIQSFPPMMGEEVQYYYRRGCKLYFRTLDHSMTMIIETNPKILEVMKSMLVFGKVYKVEVE